MIVEMSRLSLVAHQAEKGKILKEFVHCGYVETIKTQELENTGFKQETKSKESVESKLIRLNFALTFLRETAKEKAHIDGKDVKKVDLKKINELISLDNFEGIAKDEMEIFAGVSKLEEYNSELVDIKSERQRLLSAEEQLLPYMQLDVGFGVFADTERVRCFIGTIPANKVDELTARLNDKAVVETYPSDKSTLVAVIVHSSDVEEVGAALSAADFSRCPFSFDGASAKERMADVKSRIYDLDKKRVEIIREVNSLSEQVKPLKILYDYYNVELAKITAAENCAVSDKVFVLEGWVPTDKTEELKKAVESKCKYAEIFFRAPLDNEQPPTKTKNIKAVSAFDGITSMFGAPNYRESDPNIFVAMFYFLFFGIMISDAGYGLIMAIGCFAAVKLLKPVKQSGQMLIMFGFCGISTVIWGALFGGWFAATLPEGSFLDKLCWFNPLNEPLKMFMLALGMGVLQIGTGFALKGIAVCKQGHPIYAILNQFSWVVIFIGLLLISPNLMLFLGAISEKQAWFGTCSKIGTYVALVGAAMLLAGGALGKKNPIKMVTGALGNAYGAINVVSDLLSYSRLFGLGLTTGVIGYVFNMLAGIIINTFFHGMWIGYIPAIILLLIGHTFNLAINLLGAYVHNSRLQYIEFFGRFYEGSGHAFAPLGSKTRFIYLDN